MIYDAITIYNAQQRAKQVLTTPFVERARINSDGSVTKEDPKPNEFYVDPFHVTGPVELVQEQLFTAAKSNYVFDFTWNAPAPSATLNNVILPKNNVASIYAIRLLFGQGDVANTRQYLSHGFTSSDDSMYNSQLSLKIESDTPVAMIEGQQFKNTYQTPAQYDATSGLVLIEPIRVLSGTMGVFQLQLDLKNSISSLIITPSLFISARLVCLVGQAQAKATR